MPPVRTAHPSTNHTTIVLKNLRWSKQPSPSSFWPLSKRYLDLNCRHINRIWEFWNPNIENFNHQSNYTRSEVPAPNLNFTRPWFHPTINSKSKLKYVNMSLKHSKNNHNNWLSENYNHSKMKSTNRKTS